MENNIKILQIVTEQWKGRDGELRTEILGLGNDGLIYKWHRGTAKWILNVINK